MVIESQYRMEDGPTAMATIHLLMVGADEANPALCRLDLPSYAETGGDEQSAIVTGYFALDLLQLYPDISTGPQTGFLYAFSGEVLAGPVPVSLMSPDRVVKKGCDGTHTGGVVGGTSQK